MTVETAADTMSVQAAYTGLGVAAMATPGSTITGSAIINAIINGSGESTLTDTRTKLDHFLQGVERRAFVIARMALGNPDDALDAVQDAMFKLVQRYAHKPEEELTPLFYSILRRRITDMQRRQTVRRRVMAVFGGAKDGDDYDPVATAPDVSAPTQGEQIDQSVALENIASALRHLPVRQQQAFMLRMLEGLDVAETATAMGCSDGSVKTHLSRALAALRTQVDMPL